MASASSLASQQFYALRYSFPFSSLSSPSSSSFDGARSGIRFSSLRRAPTRVAGRNGSGKYVMEGSTSKLFSDLNRAMLENGFGTRVGFNGLSLKLNEQAPSLSVSRNDAIIEAKRGNPPVMPAIMTPGGPLDLSSVLFRNRIIFIGQPINSQVAQRVISQLVTLAAIDEDSDILVYLNCPGGSTYSVLAIYDCMSWIKPKVGTVCFGVAASQGALLLAGGEKGMRYAMPNARIMIHQPQSGCGGHVEDVRRQVNEAVQTRHKVDKMYSAFTGQPLEKVQQYTERDRFFSSSEALEFGIIDGVLETEY